MGTTIFYNARFLTCDPAGRAVEALAVDDGRIVFAGSARQALETAPDAAKHDLGGRMAMPGLIDIHNHHILAGRMALYEMAFPPTLTFEEILDQVRHAADTTPEGRWLVGGSYNGSLTPRMDSLQALAELDAASRGRPVLLRDLSYHTRWCNSAAMAEAGVDRATPDLDPNVGRIARDPATGDPTGLFFESAGRTVDHAMEGTNYADPEIDGKASAYAVQVLNSYGVTAFQDALTSLGMMQALASLDRAGTLTAWVVASLPAHEGIFVPGPVGTELFAMKEKFRSRHVRPDFAKILLDGIPMAMTAAMLEPYRPNETFGCCYRGGTTMTLPQLARLLADCEKFGLGVKIHCAGDGALRIAVDAVDVVRNFNGSTHLRHQIAHPMFTNPLEIPRMAAFNITADLSPITWYPGVLEQVVRMTVFDKYVDRIWPIRDFVEAGVLIAGGSDWPVVPNPDPWDGICGLVTRQNPQGGFEGALWGEQAIDTRSALEAYTIGSARALGLEAEIGSLEVGKSADFIVLDQDVLECPAKSLGKTKVLQTWFEGRQVYER